MYYSTLSCISNIFFLSLFFFSVVKANNKIKPVTRQKGLMTLWQTFFYIMYRTQTRKRKMSSARSKKRKIATAPALDSLLPELVFDGAKFGHETNQKILLSSTTQGWHQNVRVLDLSAVGSHWNCRCSHSDKRRNAFAGEINLPEGQSPPHCVNRWYQIYEVTR